MHQGKEVQGKPAAHLWGREWVDGGGDEGADLQVGASEPQLRPQPALHQLAASPWRQALRVCSGHDQGSSLLGLTKEGKKAGMTDREQDRAVH